MKKQPKQQTAKKEQPLKTKQQREEELARKAWVKGYYEGFREARVRLLQELGVYEAIEEAIVARCVLK